MSKKILGFKDSKKYYKIMCKNCRCIFLFQEENIFKYDSFRDVSCPHCGYYINVPLFLIPRAYKK